MKIRSFQFRDDTYFTVGHCEPLSVFLKKMDALERIRTDGAQMMSFDWGFRLGALFADHPEEYFRRLLGLITSGNKAEFQYAILQLESHFHWNFDLTLLENGVVTTRNHIMDLLPVVERKVEKIKPLLARLTKAGSMVEKRGVLLQHFGVALEGPPGKAWLPAIEKAALSWNYTISVNALLCARRSPGKTPKSCSSTRCRCHFASTPWTFTSSKSRVEEGGDASDRGKPERTLARSGQQ